MVAVAGALHMPGGRRLYNTELRGWYKDGRTSFTQTASRRKEIIWMNFEPVGQMDIFREGTG